MPTGSKKDILDLLKRNGALSINDIAEQTGLSKTTLREHLLQLERDGFIARELVRSGPGRPSLIFRLSRKGHAIYPSGESELARNLLVHLRENGQEDMVRSFFERFWDHRYERATHLMNEANERSCSRTDALLQLLEEEGFMPEYERTPSGDITIRACNCPYREIVRETHLPCKLESEFYRRLFDGNVERSTHIAEGDFACTYTIHQKTTSQKTI